MSTEYFMTGDDSDLSGGSNFSKALDTTAPGDSTQGISVTTNTTETDFLFTPGGDPGASGITGDYTVIVDITSGNADLQVDVAIHRVNSAGTSQASAASDGGEQTNAVGELTFTFTSADLGTWAAGDRLRVNLVQRDTSLHGDENTTYGIGSSGVRVTAPWSPAGGNFDDDISVTGSAAATFETNQTRDHALTVSGSAAADFSGDITKEGAAAFTATGAAAFEASQETENALPLSGEAEASFETSQIRDHALPLSGSASAAFETSQETENALPLSGEAAITFGAAFTYTSDVPFTGSAEVSFSGDITKEGSLTLSVSASFTPEAQANFQAGVALTADATAGDGATATLPAELAVSGAAAASLEGALIVDGALALPCTAALSGDSGLTLEGELVCSGSAATAFGGELSSPALESEISYLTQCVITTNSELSCNVGVSLASSATINMGLEVISTSAILFSSIAGLSFSTDVSLPTGPSGRMTVTIVPINRKMLDHVP
jgi:hypothetical protein